MVSDPGYGLGLSVVLDGVSSEIESLSQLIAELYSRRRVSSDLVVTPRMRLSIYLDGAKAAALLTQIIERSVEDSIIGVANMTGMRKEFEETVKKLAMLEEAKGIAMREKLIGLAALAISILIGLAVFTNFIR